MAEKKKGDGLYEGELDSSKEHQDEFLKMSDKHWEENDPDFHAMMMKHRKKHGSDKDPA